MTTMQAVFRPLFLILVVAALGLTGCAGTPEQKQIKVVYQFNEGLDQASIGLRNIRNHLDADPGVKIVAVAFSKGVDFLLDGARDKNGNPYDVVVDDLVARGVEFRVCNNTLQSRKIDKASVIPGTSIVPSGVAEAARLQAREGYVYLKP